MIRTSPINLSETERATLLDLARKAVEAAASNQPLPHIDLEALPGNLRVDAPCFVTLYQGRELRGCTGTLAARSPLAEEVVRTAAQTAVYDPRFFPVRPEEVHSLRIEISVLTPSQKLDFREAEELVSLLRPGIDGVTLHRGPYRATFLPQVWEKIPDPVQFLDMLSQKMGLSPKAWTQPGTEVETYQVVEFSDTHSDATP